MNGDNKPVPTLYEWMGGMPAVRKLMDTFYARVPDDPLLAPLFTHLGPEHNDHVARFIAEVLGGPKTYSEELGGHPVMIRHHMAKSLSEEQRERWMHLLLHCADECGIPADPEFRSAFVSYLEWGTRIAVINSQPGVPPPQDGTPMPAWNWGVVKGPFLK